MTMHLRRSWKTADSAPDSAGAFLLRLDGKPARTPDGRSFALPVEALAIAIAREWQAQGTTVRPDQMPLTQLAATAIDRIGPNKESAIDQLAVYAGTDLLCHRAESPQTLRERQEANWNPLLDWLAETSGIELVATIGITAQTQPPTSLVALQKRLAALDQFRLAAVAWSTQVTGSIVLALAILERRIDARQAFDLAELDALWQREQWGEDAEAQARFARVEQDLRETELFLRLLESEE